MAQEDIYALYDAMINAECGGDYATASSINEKLETC